MKNLTILILIVLFFSHSNVFAKRYWPSQSLSNWTLSLNNGTAYVTSPEFATHCDYSRGQINMDGTEFNKAQYAYALSAKARNKKLKYVVDDTQSVCIITGLQEVE
jgi:hypothetical protein